MATLLGFHPTILHAFIIILRTSWPQMMSFDFIVITVTWPIQDDHNAFTGSNIKKQNPLMETKAVRTLLLTV